MVVIAVEINWLEFFEHRRKKLRDIVLNVKNSFYATINYECKYKCFLKISV